MLTETNDNQPPINQSENSGPASLLKSMLAPIQNELVQFEKLLHDQLSSEHNCVQTLLEHGRRMGGKRMRPALLFLSAQAFGPVSEDHLKLAVVVEMIHTATLIHDDVLDKAESRRHLPTMNSITGNETSVLVGDFLFTKAFHLASSLPTTYACRAIGNATNVVCEGEIRQIHSKGKFAVSQSEYLEIIEAKTAALCAVSSQLGAHYAGATEPQIEAMREYGNLLGTSFQIADDILDIVGDDKKTGKSLGTDFEQNKPTLPLIHFLSVASQADLKAMNELSNLGSDFHISDFISLLDQYESLQYARDFAAGIANRAKQIALTLPENESSNCLAMLPDFVVARSH